MLNQIIELVSSCSLLDVLILMFEGIFTFWQLVDVCVEVAL